MLISKEAMALFERAVVALEKIADRQADRLADNRIMTKAFAPVAEKAGALLQENLDVARMQREHFEELKRTPPEPPVDTFDPMGLDDEGDDHE